MYGRNKREAHEKTMSSYQSFAWRDAMSVVALIEQRFSLKQAQLVHKTLGEAMLVKQAAIWREALSDFIGMTEAQRAAYIRKMAERGLDQQSILLFLLLAVIALVRVQEIIELRDQYRSILVPGRGNRITVAAVHDFGNAVFALGLSCPWPDDLLELLDQV